MLLERRPGAAGRRLEGRDVGRRQIRNAAGDVRHGPGVDVNGIVIVLATQRAVVRIVLDRPAFVVMRVGVIGRVMGVVVRVIVLRVRLVRRVKVAVFSVRHQLSRAHAGVPMRRHGRLQLPRPDQQQCQNSLDHTNQYRPPAGGKTARRKVAIAGAAV